MELKQVIVIREDLDMSMGKTSVQVAHASLSAYERSKEDMPLYARRWLEEGQTKVVCKVENLEKLEALVDKAEELGIPHFLVVDRGLTEIPPGTTTCAGFGPAPTELLDKVTGALRLLR